MTISSGTLLFISVIYCVMLSLSLYGGFSEKANVFCMGPFMFESTGIGPSGKVVIWLRVFAIFLVVCLGLLSIFLIFANMTFDKNTYEEKQRKNHEEDQLMLTEQWPGQLSPYNPKTSGYLAIDALNIYESYSVNIFHLYLLSVLFCWISWIVWGIFVLSLYVPIECTRHRIGDNTSLVMMYIVVIVGWLPFASLTAR